MRFRATWLAGAGFAIAIGACGVGTGGLGDTTGAGNVDADGPATLPGDATANGADARFDGMSTLQPEAGESDASVHELGDSPEDSAQTPGEGAPDGVEASALTDATSVGDAHSEFDAPSHDASGLTDGPTIPDSGAMDATATGGDGAVEAGAMCDAGVGCAVVPMGWTLVAYASSQSAACPAGYGAPEDVVGDPDTSSACTCGTCNVATQPDCASGPIEVYYDTITSATAGTCNMPGIVPQLGNSPAGTCRTDLYAGDYELDDLMYVPSPASGGTCSAPVTKSTNGVTYANEVRICSPSAPPTAGCGGTSCEPAPTGGYVACISAPGAVTCPSGPFSVAHVVGTGASFDCGDCGCTLSGHCTGTVTLYSDGACTDDPAPMPADGTCNEVLTYASVPVSHYGSYLYTPNMPTSVACTTTGSSAENVTMMGATTVCCTP